MKDTPYSLGLGAFLLDRGREVRAFVDRLISKRKGKNIEVPPRMRRRAMSHNRYRIPARLRAGIASQLIEKEAGQKVAACRRGLRKSRQLALLYMRRHGATRWLPTHIWMAKRMRMACYFGYKVAASPQDKGWRSTFRHFSRASVIHDISYYRAIVVQRDCAAGVEIRNEEMWRNG
jgi:ribonuclease P/MRP protein subunit POP1